MQDLGVTDPVVSTSEIIPYNAEEYMLQSNDIIEINIKTTSAEINQLFEMTGTSNSNGNMMGVQNGGDIFFMNGFFLDRNGIVELPLIGELNLKGHTLKQAKEVIENKVRQFVNEDEYFVRVRLGGIRFSALGEFNSPGKQTILQNSVTIFEAIAAAGDLNLIAKREEIVLIRQYPEGSQINKINLLDKNLLSSDFYFIRPNDVLYAEPLKAREVGSEGNFLQTLTFVTSLVSTVALVIALISK
ncbi:polysaccharide biosynthesis/export family protein [Algoriphagus ratkowskyi]|nr:polysaccharide biosynthesis/export family protein [Algoriphagus ratkowskyi]TXD79050.1 sugar transporter [Algoriphagus ratkowskyi]